MSGKGEVTSGKGEASEGWCGAHYDARNRSSCKFPIAAPGYDGVWEGLLGEGERGVCGESDEGGGDEGEGGGE